MLAVELLRILAGRVLRPRAGSALPFIAPRDHASVLAQLQRSTEQLRARAEQQAVVASLSQRALTSTDLAGLMQEAVALIAETLAAAACVVWRYLPDGVTLQLQAGAGPAWGQAPMGQLCVSAGGAGGAAAPPGAGAASRLLLRLPGMSSGTQVVIPGHEQPYGLLELYDARQRTITADEVNFLQTSANVLSTAIFRDRAVSALRDQQAQLAGIVDTAMDAIVTVDVDQRIVLVNRAAEYMFRRSAADMIGAPLDRLIPERYRIMHPGHVHQFGQSNVVKRTINALVDVSGVRADGEEFPIEMSISQIEVAGRRLYTAILRDISQRKQDEAAIRRLLRQVSSGRTKLQMLSRRLLEVQEEERRHIARELHDEIGQELTGLNLILEVGNQISEQALRERLSAAQQLVTELTSRVRQLSLDLRPAMLDDLGLLPTLLWHFKRYTEQTKVAVHFQHTGLDRRFAPDVEISAYRGVQEALTNVARHACVGEVTVCVWANADILGLQIEDQGRGFDPATVLARRDTSGLAGIRERMILLGGDLRVESTPGSGTSITAELPLSRVLERRRSER